MGPEAFHKGPAQGRQQFAVLRQEAGIGIDLIPAGHRIALQEDIARAQGAVISPEGRPVAGMQLGGHEIEITPAPLGTAANQGKVITRHPDHETALPQVGSGRSLSFAVDEQLADPRAVVMAQFGVAKIARNGEAGSAEMHEFRETGGTG